MGDRCVFPLSPTARGYTKSEGYCSEMANCDLYDLLARADTEVISGVRKVSNSKQDRREIELIMLEMP